MAGNGRTAKGLLINIAFSVGVFLFLCAAAEGLLRIYAYAASTRSIDVCDYTKHREAYSSGLYRPSQSPGLIYELRPNFKKAYKGKDVNDLGPEEIRINADGLREDHDYAIPKPPNTFRIAAIGDSTTFGWSVDAKGSYPRILEANLRSMWPENKQVEVMNFGVPGYRGKQILAALEVKVPKYDPDLVIFGWLNSNDLPPSRSSVWTLSPLWRFLTTNIYIFSCLRPGVQPAAALPERYAENGSGSQTAKEVFDALASFSREKKIPVVVTVMPIWQTREENAADGTAAVNQLILRIAEKSGLHASDLLPSVENIAESVGNQVGRTIEFYRTSPADTIHPTGLGNAFDAAVIYNYLVKNKFVPLTSVITQINVKRSCAGESCSNAIRYHFGREL